MGIGFTNGTDEINSLGELFEDILDEGYVFFVGDTNDHCVVFFGESTVRYSFANCAALTTVDFSEGLLSIGEYAFVNCSTLTTITFPDSLKELGEFSFYGCAELNEISFGLSLNKIQKYAFYQLKNIKKVHVKQDMTWGHENNSIFDQEFYKNTPADNAKKLLSFDIDSWIIK